MQLRLLGTMQHGLEQLYGLDNSFSVTEFLTTNRAFLNEDQQSATEALLINAATDGFDLSLFLDADLLDGLARDDPYQWLHDDNLDAFFVVLEGVSHFVYLLWNLRYGRRVSQLELELQAEVDKFISSAHLIWQQRDRKVPRQLRQSLFDQVSYAEHLSPHQQQMYQRANYYAGHYCWHLEQQFQQRYDDRRMLNELRRFYRLPQQAKLQHIDRGLGR